MKSSTPVIRLGLFALTGAIIVGVAALNPRLDQAHVGIAASLPVVTLGTISVHPSQDDLVATPNSATQSPPTLPTIHVHASEEERLAALIDPTDQIQVFSPITVLASAEDIAAALRPAVAQTDSGSADETDSTFGAVLSEAVSEHHRLRLDMPYYSVGKVLAHAHKN